MSTASLQISSASPAPQSPRAASNDDTPLADILTRARSQGQAQGLPFAGSVTPPEAWALHTGEAARLVDVRTAEERKFVGHVPDVLHVAWATGTSMNRNPRFVREAESKLAKDAPVLLLCRSGKRSAAAAEALTRAGFTQVFNVLEGFEGDLNGQQQRGELGGWRRHGLPWVQD
jgi:rhodanese-related sulfurtransferase